LSLSTISVLAVAELLGIDDLLPELIIGLGLALLIGNGLAWWKNRQGATPEGVESAIYRPGRVRFLVAVGVLMTIWGVITLVN
jgi:hypothetical protein